MKIAYWSYGYLTPYNIAADGGYHIRYSLIKELVNDGHEICWIHKFRDKDIPADATDLCYHKVSVNTEWNANFTAAEKRYKEFTNPGTKIKDWYAATLKGQREDLPEVDACILEINAMGLKKYDILSVLDHYTRRGVQCFLYDQDMWGPGLQSTLKHFPVEEKNVYFLTPYSATKFKQQIVLYYGYDSANDVAPKLTKRSEPFVFVGNDYGKGQKMIKFYTDLNCHIYGNYKKDKENIKGAIGEDKFLGSIAPDKVVPKLSEYSACIQVTQKKYEKVGLMTQRLNELANAGTLCFMDADIRDAQKFTLADQVIATPRQATERLASWERDNEIPGRLEKQKLILPTFKSQLHKLYEVIK